MSLPRLAYLISKMARALKEVLGLLPRKATLVSTVCRAWRRFRGKELLIW